VTLGASQGCVKLVFTTAEWFLRRSEQTFETLLLIEKEYIQ